MADIQSLAGGFSNSRELDWQVTAQKALIGAKLESLFSRSSGGEIIKPIYPRASGVEPVAGRDSAWAISTRVDHPDPKEANRLLLDALAHGASEVALVFQGAPTAYGFGLPLEEASLRQALDGVELNAVLLRIEPHPRALESAVWISELVNEAASGKVGGTLSYGVDMVGSFARHGVLPADRQADNAQIAAMIAALKTTDRDQNNTGLGRTVVEADGRVYHDAGASDAVELGAIFATIADILRGVAGTGADIVDVMAATGVSLAVNQNQLESIAKLRACRLLWSRLAEVLALPHLPPLRIHAQTSWPMMTRRDPHCNLLRTTLAAFAAGVGGANKISVLPFTQALGLADVSARRLACNTQLLLMEESHIDAVMDPAAGSGALEALTDATCHAAWEVFGAIEKAGGMVEALAAGMVQKLIAQHRQSVRANIAEGSQAIVGVTVFGVDELPPAEIIPAESPLDPEFNIPVTTCAPLEPWRLANDYEPDTSLS